MVWVRTFEAFRVGPVETHQGNFTLYAACSPAGAVTRLIVDGWPQRQLRELLPDRIAAAHPELVAGELDALLLPGA